MFSCTLHNNTILVYFGFVVNVSVVSILVSNVGISGMELCQKLWSAIHSLLQSTGTGGSGVGTWRGGAPKVEGEGPVMWASGGFAQHVPSKAPSKRLSPFEPPPLHPSDPLRRIPLRTPPSSPAPPSRVCLNHDLQEPEKQCPYFPSGCTPGGQEEKGHGV